MSTKSNLYLCTVLKLINYLLIFYFSIGACFPNCDFGQLIKVKELMAHYELHKQEAQDIGETINLPEFFYIHFVNGDAHESDHHDEHKDFPLLQLGTGVDSFVLGSFELPSLHDNNENPEEKITTDTQILSSEYTSSHFQPPSV